MMPCLYYKGEMRAMKIIYNERIYISLCKSSDWIKPNLVPNSKRVSLDLIERSSEFCQQFIFDILSQRLNVFVYRCEITVTATNANTHGCVLVTHLW